MGCGGAGRVVASGEGALDATIGFLGSTLLQLARQAAVDIAMQKAILLTMLYLSSEIPNLAAHNPTKPRTRVLLDLALATR
jgi:hypothetical protein